MPQLHAWKLSGDLSVGQDFGKTLQRLSLITSEDRQHVSIRESGSDSSFDFMDRISLHARLQLQR